jgi:hypothetical protein
MFNTGKRHKTHRTILMIKPDGNAQSCIFLKDIFDNKVEKLEKQGWIYKECPLHDGKHKPMEF